ncbi:MAG: DUF3781 domain-containing protein [Tannerellaceae bacterium]|nr:DUF3781 domain-containing protein [Tannerellaceae bacterium]
MEPNSHPANDRLAGGRKQKIENPVTITRTGKNWYVRGDGFVITINAQSFTIITVHREKNRK